MSPEPKQKTCTCIPHPLGGLWLDSYCPVHGFPRLTPLPDKAVVVTNPGGPDKLRWHWEPVAPGKFWTPKQD